MSTKSFKNRKVPVKIRAQFENCFDKLVEAKQALPRRRRRCLWVFSASTAFLIAWFLVNPFIAGVGERYLSQSLALLLIALGGGYLGALRGFSELPGDLNSATMELMRIEDRLGVDLANNEGDPVEVSRHLDDAMLKEYETRLEKIAAQASKVDSAINRSFYEVYVDLFNYVSGEIRSKPTQIPPGNSGNQA